MKILLVVALTLLPLFAAQADHNDPNFDEPNVLGLFFSGSEFSVVTNGIVSPPAPFNAYIVAFNPEVETLGGYEVGISMSDPTVLILSAVGPNDWANAGDGFNQIVRFETPLPVVDAAAVVCTIQMLYMDNGMVDICFGQAAPQSIPGHDGPVLVDGDNLANLIPCGSLYDENQGGWVAVLNPDHGTPIQNGSFSQLKALFY